MDKRKRRTKSPPATAVQSPARASFWEKGQPFIERHAVLLLISFLVIATARIAATYPVYTHTIDEPAHIACGMEWLSNGTYRLETQHPPLARVMTALLPYLDGNRYFGRGEMYTEGTDQLYRNGHYWRTLTLARVGVLPFFWLATVVVFLWTRRHFSTVHAVAAVFLFTFTPAILAHSGLATTDMGVTCFLTFAFFAMLVWLERPTVLTSLLFGTATGLAVLCKLSALAFFPAAVVALLAAWLLFRRRETAGWNRDLPKRVLLFLLAVVAGAFVIWAGYRFSVGKTSYASFPLPAPELFSGIGEVRAHDKAGHPSYLLGRYSHTGFFAYYPIDLTIKTPLAILILFGLGVWYGTGKRRTTRNGKIWIPLALGFGILAFAINGNINIGVRHVLPLYPLMAIVGAAGLIGLLDAGLTRPWATYAGGSLALWLVISTAAAHPDYLPYFNEIASRHPEEWVADSDLDWGQDMQRLADKLKEVGAREVVFEPFTLGEWAYHGFPPMRKMNVEHPLPGWNAVSLTNMKVTRFGIVNPEARNIKLWPELIPPTYKVGKGIWLWHFPSDVGR